MKQVCVNKNSAVQVIKRDRPEEKRYGKNEVKGKVKQVKGKVEETAGKVSGKKSLEMKGKADQVVGKVQETVGKAQGTVKKTAKKLK